MLLSETAIPPSRSYGEPAGYDLYAPENTTIQPRGKQQVKTGIALKPPPGTYARVVSRSGFCWKKHTGIEGGVIDADYRGEIIIIMFNFSDDLIVINAGDKIAQFVLEKYVSVPMKQVESFVPTERGSKGFGSSDKKNN